MFVVAIALVAVIWEGYKAIGPEDGGDILGIGILPKTSARAMPHIWTMVGRFDDPVQRGSDQSVLRVVLEAVSYSFRVALAGFGLGVLVGMALAIVMLKFKVAERAVLPYLVISQTVPLIALAPLVAGWGGKLQLSSFVWPKWMSVAVLGAFLAFFPVALGTLRGLKSPSSASLELMDSLASPWRRTLWKLRFPAAVPFIVPALKLAASLSVIGVVVSEISIGLRGGVGRLIIDYANQATGDPAKVYTSIFGAALLGLGMAVLVAIVDLMLMRNRPKGAAS